MKNKILIKAKNNKNDEFFTQYTDIEKEMQHYKEHFKEQIIYCNCDNPYSSNFVKYFLINFKELKLKKLIATSYAYSKTAQEELSLFPNKLPNQQGYKLIINKKTKLPKFSEPNSINLKLFLKQKVKKLKFNGDFQSEECVKLLKKATIIISNPPFSLFRQYVNLLTLHKKKFIILGNQNAIAYKQIFKLFKENKIWLGASIHSGDREFLVPDNYDINTKNYRIDEFGNKFIKVTGIRWFTNIEYPERNKPLYLTKKYTPKLYPKYDNYDAIEVSKTADIPYDYDGIMGVPITFIDKYNPQQFKILGDSRYHDNQDFPDDINIVKGKMLYRRILIQKIRPQN